MSQRGWERDVTQRIDARPSSVRPEQVPGNPETHTGKGSETRCKDARKKGGCMRRVSQILALGSRIRTGQSECSCHTEDDA